MSSNEQTKTDIDEWIKPDNQKVRYGMLSMLANQAGLTPFFNAVPIQHFEKMSYDQYMINVYAMAKIRELKRIAPQ